MYNIFAKTSGIFASVSGGWDIQERRIKTTGFLRKLKNPVGNPG